MKWTFGPTPFLEERHLLLAGKVADWSEANSASLHPRMGVHYWDDCRKILRILSEAGFLEYVIPHARPDGPAGFDLRSICVIREGLSFESNVAATLFSVQGMGLSPIVRVGDEAQRSAYLESARQGNTVAAIAITEPMAGSDVAGITSTAIETGNGFLLSGEKTWIANGAIADHFLVLAKAPKDDGQAPIAAFIVDRRQPGIIVHPDLPMGDDCPLSMVSFEDVELDKAQLIGSVDDGLRSVMAGFDVFRPSVGASAAGVAKRAMAEAIAWVQARQINDAPMARLDSVQAQLAEMAADTEVASLAVYHAAWRGDVIRGRFSKEAAIAKLVATEAAQRVVDRAVQLCGAMGVCRNSVVERLYREVRPMRIYEGASEVQKLIIARNIIDTRGKS